jgi:hypothetical protein
VTAVGIDQSGTILVFALKSGIIGVTFDAKEDQVIYFDVLHPSTVTAITITDSCFYVGTHLGIVSKFDIARAVSTMPPTLGIIANTHNCLLAQIQNDVRVTRILELQSTIVQMSWSEDLGVLLVSSLIRSVLCDTRKKTFTEVGKRLRNGRFGACILCEDVIAARPGLRLWKAGLNGDVIHTYQFHLPCRRDEAPTVSRHKKMDTFTKLFTLGYQRIVSFSPNGLYVMNVGSEDDPIITCKAANVIIKDIRVWENKLFILTSTHDIMSYIVNDEEFYLEKEFILNNKTVSAYKNITTQLRLTTYLSLMVLCF